MGCCIASDATQKDAWAACKSTIKQAIETQCNDEPAAPTLVDALPTLGKTTAVAKLTPRLCTTQSSRGVVYLSHLVRNREEFQAQLAEHPDASSLEISQLPRFVDQCPTARGDYGDAEKDQLLELYDRGISPGVLHSHQGLDLPCGGSECPYMQQWQAINDDDVLIGHPSHAYVTEVITDRVVVFDEGPGDAFETTFNSDRWHTALRNYIDGHPEFPVDSVGELKKARYNAEEATREAILGHLRSMQREDYQRQLIDQTHAHADIAYAIRLFVRETGSIRDMGAPPYKIELPNGVEHAQLEANVVGAYDPESAKITIRRTPELRQANAVVGLDGTPTPSLWQGRLGVSDLAVERVLCTDCRKRYVNDVLGYNLIQTSKYRKPYSSLSGNRPNYAKDRGLLHTVHRHADGSVGVISTKAALDALFEYEDANTIPIEKETQTNHYGNLRSSNQFAGTDIQTGVVIGSRHPGSTVLRQLAGLDRVAYRSEPREITVEGHTFTATAPTSGHAYLQHFREHSVVQAIFRFGRQDGATVYIHTAALPEWLQTLTNTATVEERSAGEQAVWQALETIEAGPTTAFVNEIDTIGRSQIRKILNALNDEGIVDKGGTKYRTIWEQSDLTASPTARVIFPDNS